ncbi:sn-glycerol-3-phosphate ABC transporter permease UgpE [Falsiroseomonas selenitidurans]|uniref:sn-glycerol-3-phosphate transport system permease protein UgpE n=1 Tax=Falsiroseomonas selenitidurans TaxID=2716335 RepID=A0ABX1E302_9PROT|nr:sn-glycerol-3-phosphate ABC transporter permease UgpE [Falsiroseomonas selenitidurans]NKC29350.1 sn-glycerol-3-phosphate ABC transporter permease UgpE [Falsiroseomonas selenitidurans]
MQAAPPADRRRRRADLLTHIVLILGVLLFALPVWIVLMGSTHDGAAIGRGEVPLLPGAQGLDAYRRAWTEGAVGTTRVPVALMLWNSFVMAMLIALGKIAISLTSAYAVVFFRFPGRMLAFWAIFITLMLPVEVRIFPTFKVVSDLGMVNTYAGLIIPLIASATATLLFRQFFLTIPDEFVEAAKMDGAGPLRFFRDIVLPLSRTNMAALFVILFVYGWNQYLWPLLVTTSADVETIVIGIVKMIGTESNIDWSVVMATTVLALLPPIAVVVLMQRWFVQGLTDTEK